MRSLFALIFLCLAGWLGYSDYKATAAEGQELALTPTIDWWQKVSPGTYEAYLPKLQEAEVPYLWEPVMRTVLNWPAAVLFGGLALFFFLIRRKSEPHIEVG